MINILIVDDSAIIRAILKQILSSDERFSICGEAANGADAITKCKALHPDLIIMDINMPVMNGIDSTKQIMKECPTAIVIFSTEDTARYGFEGINAGAIEMISKPDLSSSSASFYNDFKEKLYLIGSQYKKSVVPSPAINEKKSSAKVSGSSVILVGASTGGPIAVQTLLKGLGSQINVPILLTQHIDESFARHYTDWLAETTGLPVRFAVNGEVCSPGHVYVAPPDYHMTIETTESSLLIIRLNQNESVHFLRPAVDPLFISGAKNIGSKCIGVLLTGMGRDGADGCVQLKKAGAFTICESEETCSVFGMPKAAIEDGGACMVLPVYKIGNHIKQMLGL